MIASRRWPSDDARSRRRSRRRPGRDARAPRSSPGPPAGRRAREVRQAEDAADAAHEEAQAFERFRFSAVRSRSAVSLSGPDQRRDRRSAYSRTMRSIVNRSSTRCARRRPSAGGAASSAPSASSAAARRAGSRAGTSRPRVASTTSGVPPTARRDDRQAGGHRLENRQRHAFADRAVHVHVAAGEPGARVVPMAEEHDPIADSELRGRRLERRALRTVADNDEPDRARHRRDRREARFRDP